MSDGDIASRCRDAAVRARAAAAKLRRMTSGERSSVLREIAASIRAARAEILAANAKDLEAGAGLAAALRDRLTLDESRIESMAAAVDAIAGQPDPVGRVVEGRELANGVRLEKRRTPIGVIVVIYESRPNITSDAAALCLRAGNAVLLKGGSESINSNRAIVGAITGAIERAGLDGIVGFIDSTDRAAVGALVSLEGLVDLAIPRGGPGLIRAVTESARVPVVKHDAGNCHLYIDGSIDEMRDVAMEIALNAKTQRPGVCNAIETLLVHKDATDLLAPLCRRLSEVGVEIRGDARVCAEFAAASAATQEDWATEFLALTLAIRVVDSLDDACAHIAKYGSGHTEAIVTSSVAAADRFVSMVDSANVMVNCSTRFADGGEYGLGAEIGISTNKLHARGPMGAEDLTTYQWVLRGDGQIRL